MKVYKKRRFWQWLMGIVGGLILILAAAAIYLNSKWKPLLTENVKEGIYTASNHLYQIDFKDIHINILTGSVVLDSVRLIPDTNVYNQLKKLKKAPTHSFSVKVAHVKLSRIKILTAYFDRKINLNEIVLTKPSIDMVYRKVPKSRDRFKDEQTLYQQISKSIKSIRVAAIRLVDADFDYYNGSQKLNAVKKLNVTVKDILIDSAAQFDSTRVLHAKNIGFELIGYQSATKDKMYNLKVDSLLGSISSRTLRIKGFKLVPKFPELEFSRKYRIQKDRYNLDFSEIRVSDIDFIKLNTEGILSARRVEIGPAKVAVFLNRELPPPAIDKGRNYPHNALKRLAFPMTITRVDLSQVDIAYTEFNPKNNQKGTLKLENLGGELLNLTNDSLDLQTNNHAFAKLHTSILGVGKLNINIDFNLTDRAAAFSYNGTVNSFNMAALNPLSKSLGEVEIENGNVRHVAFSINANEKGSRGKVEFLYSGLKIKLLKEGDDGKTEKKGLLSFLANTLLIKDENPSKGEAARTANIVFKRVQQASFFNLMWKSIFVGIRDIVGIGSIPMKTAPKAKMTKKEERVQRREARRLARSKS